MRGTVREMGRPKSATYGWLGGGGRGDGVTVNDVEPLTPPKVAVMVVVPATADTAKDVDPLIAPEVAVIVVAPGAPPAASPSLVTVATFVAEEFQVAEVVRFLVLPSLSVPIAVNCTLAATTMDEFAGATAIDLRVGVDGGEGDGGEDAPPPPHPRKVSTATAISNCADDFILSRFLIPNSLFSYEASRAPTLHSPADPFPLRHPAALYRVTAFQLRCIAEKLRPGFVVGGPTVLDESFALGREVFQTVE